MPWSYTREFIREKGNQEYEIMFLHVWNMTYFEEFRHVISSSIDPLKEWIWDSICFAKSSFQKKNSLKKYFYSSGSIHISNIYENTFFLKVGDDVWHWKIYVFCYSMNYSTNKKYYFFSFANILKCSYILYSGNPLCMNFAFWEYAINGHLRIL